MSSEESRKNILVDDSVAENITRVEELAYELKIREVMERNVRTLDSELKMQSAADLFRQQRISGAPVTKNGELIGILSIEDVIRCLVANDMDAPVTRYMTSKVRTIMATDPVVEALKFFVNTGVGRLPVLDEKGNMEGIITKGDLTSGLLFALQRSIQEEELKTYRASHLFEDITSNRTSLILRYVIQPRDFTHGGTASSNIKRALLRMGASPQIARRCGIAAYEAEMNLIIHTTNGGNMRVEIEPHKIALDVFDYGPGIPDIESAMKPGYSTATDSIRELGFGAGMGLVNIARCVDSMKLESVVGKGTRLKMTILLESETVGEGYAGKKEVS
ncbi:MAG: CBS domain-containing protein [Anaerolineaceae bacterium]|nr:CBS domain-containing protein [Anaerolineaceae bacterium]